MMNFFRKSAGPGALVAAMLAGPAEASTLPRVDFSAGDKIVAVGVFDVDFDYALTDRLGIGGTMIPMPLPSRNWFDPVLSPFFAAVRSTYRAGEPLGLPVGLTVCYGVVQEFNSAGLGGSVNPFPGLPLLQHNYAVFLQPALNVAVPLGQDPEHWTLRATLGPIIAFDPGPRLAMPAWPNLEFSRPIGNHGELTLLGNGLVGWRGSF